MSKADFQYIDHLSDAVIEAYGGTLSEAFGNSARAMINVICDVSTINVGKRLTIETTGFDQKSLLYNWLEKVLLALLVDNMALAKFDVRIERRRDRYYLFGVCMGEPFVEQKHHYKIEVKAITYHGMKISRRKGKFIVRFLVDL
jgi:protein archease